MQLYLKYKRILNNLKESFVEGEGIFHIEDIYYDKELKAIKMETVTGKKFYVFPSEVTKDSLFDSLSKLSIPATLTGTVVWCDHEMRDIESIKCCVAAEQYKVV